MAADDVKRKEMGRIGEEGGNVGKGGGGGREGGGRDEWVEERH